MPLVYTPRAKLSLLLIMKNVDVDFRSSCLQSVMKVLCDKINSSAT